MKKRYMIAIGTIAVVGMVVGCSNHTPADLRADAARPARAAATRRALMVTGLVEAFPLCRILVTSRTYAYQQQAWRLPGFAEAVLAPFESGQIERFVDRWYAHIGALRGWATPDWQGRAVLLRHAIDGQPGVGQRLRSVLQALVDRRIEDDRWNVAPERAANRFLEAFLRLPEKFSRSVGQPRLMRRRTESRTDELRAGAL